MKNSQILKMTKEQLMGILMEKNVPINDNADINRLRTAVRGVMAEKSEEDDDLGVAEGSVNAGGEPAVISEVQVLQPVLDKQLATVASINAEVSRLEKLRELYELRRLTAEAKEAAEKAEARANSTVTNLHREDTLEDPNPSFSDDGRVLANFGRRTDRLAEIAEFEVLVQKFTGDDNVNVRRWVADFETAADTYQLNDERRWFVAKRLLSGSAKIYFSDNKEMSWARFRNQLIEIFDRQLSGNDICEQLERRTIKRNESALQYFITMRDIASQCELEERDIVRFIVKGLNDKTGTAASLYYANNLSELRRSLILYDKIRTDAEEISDSPIQNVARVKNNLQSPIYKTIKKSALPVEVPDIRCFNCRRKGHHSDDCKLPKRPENACFRCWEVGHHHRECPKKNTVAVVNSNTEDIDSLSDEIAALEMPR